MAFQIYRLTFMAPLQFYEQMGDPVTSSGGSPVPALRSALRHSVSVATFDNAGETVTSRLKLRRQFRSLVNNTPMKLQGIPVFWDEDPENNGWYMPDQGQLVDIDGSVGLATGVFKVENFVWIVAGRPRTHRRANWVYVKDLRTGQWARDFRRLIYWTDFSGMPALALNFLPPGSSDPLTTGGNAPTPRVQPEGWDGGAGYATSGLLDLARISYEQPKSQAIKGTVVVYDRRGEQVEAGPTTGPGPSWEEFYGPDYPYSWLDSGVPDAPVIENGMVRVRYDGTGIAGFRIDATNTAGVWSEQGKVTIGRLSGINPFLDTLVSASLVEYSETRAVVQCVMRASGDPTSREEIFITLQRGWSGPRFEIYTTPTSGGVLVDSYFVWSCAQNDTDVSVIKQDLGPSGVVTDIATALGTGHTGKLPVGGIGEATFGSGGGTGGNWVAMARWGKGRGVQLAVQRQSNSPATTVSEAYGPGIFRNAIQIAGSTKDGYLSVHMGFPLMPGGGAFEAESMTLGTGTVSVVDAEASGGKATEGVRTTDANPHVSTPTWNNGQQGKYRVFARVRVVNGAEATTIKVRAQTTATTGSNISTTSTGYVWLDLGDIVADGSTLEIHAWITKGGAGAKFFVDRIEAFQLEDRTAVTQYIGGARDLGQSVLNDSRMFPTIVSRST